MGMPAAVSACGRTHTCVCVVGLELMIFDHPNTGMSEHLVADFDEKFLSFCLLTQVHSQTTFPYLVGAPMGQTTTL